MNDRAPSAARLSSLGSLRAIAAVFVFLGHLVWIDRDAYAHPGAHLPLFNQQGTGVGVFFCLSGVVITWTYGERFAAGASRADVKRFLWRRVARLYPLYLLAVLLFIPSGRHDGDAPRWLLAQVVGVQSWFDDKHAYYGWHGAGWAVSTEAFFYVAFPVLAVVLLHRLRTPRQVLVAWLTIWALLIAGYVVAEQRSYSGVGYWLYIFPPTRTLEFMLGMLVGWAAVHGWIDELARRAQLAPLALGASAFVLFGPTRWPLVYVGWFVPMISLTLLVLVAGRGPTLLTHPRLEQVGETSYAFYLLHLLVLLVVGLGLRQAGLEGSAELAVGGPLALVAAIGVGTLAHQRIEQPAQRRLTAARSGPPVR